MSSFPSNSHIQTDNNVISRFQAAVLVGAPSFPNAVVWSDENLIAVASGHLVTILSPASLPFGPRGLITIQNSQPFPIGVIDRQDLFCGRLLPTVLSRDHEPCVRSISWSPVGLASNAGCLLAVCTAQGLVKLYRAPFCDFGAEWIVVADISSKLYEYLVSINFEEVPVCSSNMCDETEIEHGLAQSVSTRGGKRQKANMACIRRCNSRFSKTVDALSFPSDSSDEFASSSNPYSKMDGQQVPTVLEIDYEQSKERNSNHIVPASKSKVKPLKKKKIEENCTLPHISADQYASRSAMLSSLVVAWSPMLQSQHKICSVPQDGSSVSLLAVGGKSGKVSLWRISVPECYSVNQCGVPTPVVLIGIFQAHNSWITAICWALLDSDSLNPQVLLTTASSDGSVRIWLAYKEQLLKSSEPNHISFSLLHEVATVDPVPILVLSVIVPAQCPHRIHLAVGKGSGLFEVCICDLSTRKFDKVGPYDAHDQAVTGLAWAFDGQSLYSCSQDNTVRCWILSGSSLRKVPILSNAPRVRSSTDLPDEFVSCFGLAVSPGNLVIAWV